MNKENKENKKNTISIFIIIVFIVSLLNFGIYMKYSSQTIITNEWGQVAYSNEKEKQKIEKDQQKEIEKQEIAKEIIEKYDDTFKFVATITAFLGVVLSIIAVKLKEKVLLHILLTIIIVLGALTILA